MVNKQKICIRQHELSQQPVVLEVRAGQTILAMLREVMARHGQPGAEIAEGVTVTIEGREVPRRLWAHVRPRVGKHVHATCFSLEGSGAKQIIGAVIMIAVAWWAMAAIGALGTTSGMLGTYTGSVLGLSGGAAMAAVAGVYMLGSNTVPSLIIPRPQ